MSFPTTSLRPASGNLYAYLMQNQRTGLARGVYWGVCLEFEPIAYLGETVKTSITTDWIPWKVRSWRQLDGQSLDCKYDDDGVEASFYTGVHDYGDRIKLAIRHSKGASFDVAMTLVVDFTGHDGSKDADPALEVSGQLDVPFECIYYDPSNFEESPSSDEEARTLASQFLDMDDFVMKPRKSGGYKLLPKLG